MSTQTKPAARSQPPVMREMLTGVPEGYDGLVLAQLAGEASARTGTPQAMRLIRMPSIPLMPTLRSGWP